MIRIFWLMGMVLSLALLGSSCGKASYFPGPQGLAGVPGKPCTVMTTETGALITCPDGSTESISNGATGVAGAQGIQGQTGAVGATGATGEQGATGATGAQGAQGEAGQDGRDASPVTVVQLCESHGRTVYPTNFPEQALCISDKLYGVYWTGHQAFLAEIVPGTYRSTSPQGCTLTVGPCCSVTEN